MQKVNVISLPNDVSSKVPLSDGNMDFSFIVSGGERTFTFCIKNFK